MGEGPIQFVLVKWSKNQVEISVLCQAVLELFLIWGMNLSEALWRHRENLDKSAWEVHAGGNRIHASVIADGAAAWTDTWVS